MKTQNATFLPVKAFAHACLLVFILLSPMVLIAQSDYDKGWKALDEADVETALQHFETAVKQNDNAEKALLCLNMLYSYRNRSTKALAYFREYMSATPDFYPALFALWLEDGVLDYPTKKSEAQLALLKELQGRADNPLARATRYHLCYHYRMSNDIKQMKRVAKELSTLNTWQMVGPFDNVMNNGFDKSFGPLEHPEASASFNSKYGAKVSWFTPKHKAYDGYIFQKDYFLGSSSIMYAQTFVASEEEQNVLLKLGYSGSLKLWLNDQEVYAEKQQRRTELDFYCFEVKLNKGHNRILVQLGNFNEQTPSYSLRLTTLQGENLDLPCSATAKSYSKNASAVKPRKHFAIAHYEKLVQQDPDILNQLLLAKSYERAFDLQKAEDIYKSLFKDHPNNYFVLRQLVLLYKKANNNTNQNKYFGHFEKKYPLALDILDSDLSKAFKDKDKKTYKEKTDLYLSLYGSRNIELAFKVGLASMDNDISTILSLTDTLYKLYPENYDAVSAKFNLEKDYYSNPAKAKQVLLDYFEQRYDYSFLEKLISLYQKEGDFDAAMKILEEQHAYSPVSSTLLKKMVNLYFRQQKYDEAIAVCEEILSRRPSDYWTMKDIALLSEYKKDKKKALAFYEKTVAFNPFSFEMNEKVRELKGLQKAMDFVPEVKPHEIIAAYEAKNKVAKKEAYDILLETKSNILFKSSALGVAHSYIIKINEESAIEDWQRVSFSSSSNYNFNFKETKTIKKDGSEITAERNNKEVVFTNLEVGDYIFISYTEVQRSGGKTTKFVSEEFAFNTYNPSYIQDFSLYVEEDLPINYTVSSGELEPKISKKEGFVHYNWSVTFPEILKSEKYALPFNDISTTVHYSVNQSWPEIVSWYSDLSSHQAEPDYPIEEIAEDLLGNHQGSVDEKFRLIYDFVCKNIQYSSINFRQSGYIPQRASNTYHSRLGDCKDVSTLFVSIARAADLKANLVLINTSDNGKKSVLLPSLNFNHCIVKAYTEQGAKYLELTDSNLPYGHLYYYHKNAPILEIPHASSAQTANLTYLDFNPGFENWVKRTTKLKVAKNNKLKLTTETKLQGTNAANVCYNYYNEDATRRKEILKERYASKFKSNISVEELSFPNLEPLANRASCQHTINVENDILKLGSMKTLKLPFSDLIIMMNVFEEGERKYDFDYVRYEDTEYYEETITVELEEGMKFIEVPENIQLEFNQNLYQISFEKLNEASMKIKRSYRSHRENIKAEDFKAFKDFMTQINEAENTHLLFK